MLPPTSFMLDADSLLLSIEENPVAQPPKGKNTEQQIKRPRSSTNLGEETGDHVNTPVMIRPEQSTSAESIAERRQRILRVNPAKHETTEGVCQTIPELGAIPYANHHDAQRRVVRLVSVGNDAELSIELQQGINKIGRQKTGNHIVLMSGEVSRFHAEIEMTDEVITLRDLNSANGTFVNGDRITERILQAGNKIGFSEKFTFQILIDMVMELPDTVTFQATPSEAKHRTRTLTPAHQNGIPLSLEQRRQELEARPYKWRDTSVGYRSPKSPAQRPVSLPQATKSPARTTAPQFSKDEKQSGISIPTKRDVLRGKLPEQSNKEPSRSITPIQPAKPSTALVVSEVEPSVDQPKIEREQRQLSVQYNINQRSKRYVLKGKLPEQSNKEPSRSITPIQPAKPSTALVLRDSDQSVEQSMVDRERRQLSVLYNISRRCMATQDLEELDKLLINVLERIIAFERGFIMYQLPNGDWKLVMSPKGDQWDRTVVRSLLQTAHQVKAPIRVLDSSNDDRLGSMGMGRPDARMLIPLLSRGAPIGAIFLISQRPDSFDDHNVDFLSLFADITALSIVNCCRIA